MKIDQELCIGCGQCQPYCPVGVITLQDDQADIDFDECVECGNCLRMAECPVDAIYQQELAWPRTVRSLLSDPQTVTVEAGIPGRGTEEMKTNDVTGRFKPGMVGIAIEVGRPVTGARFYDIEKVAQAVARLGNVTFETNNPTTSLMSDQASGTFQRDLLNEKVMSAILEFAVKFDQMPQLFENLKAVSGEIDAVFSLDVATRLNADESVPTKPFFEASGLWIAANGKTNVGLGRPFYQEDPS
jgi:NAD-dependent dihydropyrimidine dehydrogenase PreA subunit